MKFFTSILGLAMVTSTVTAATIDFGLNRGLHIEEIKYRDPEGNFFEAEYAKNLSEACYNDLKKSGYLSKCNGTFDTDDFTEEVHKKNCEIFLSDECQEFNEKFKNPLDIFPNCVNDTDYIEFLKIQSKGQAIQDKYYCTLNGDGKVCPAVMQMFSNGTSMYEDYMKDCEYKSCLDNRLEFLEYSKKYGHIINIYVMGKDNVTGTQEDHEQFYDTLIGYHKSQECTSKTKDDTANAKLIKSGAESLKPFGSLLSLLLISLYLLF